MLLFQRFIAQQTSQLPGFTTVWILKLITNRVSKQNRSSQNRYSTFPFMHHIMKYSEDRQIFFYTVVNDNTFTHRWFQTCYKKDSNETQAPHNIEPTCVVTIKILTM